MAAPDEQTEGDVASRPLPARRKSKGASKPVRHRRWRRIVTVVTVLGLAAFAWGTVSFLNAQQRDEDLEATEAILDDIEHALVEHHQRTGVLPQRFHELVNAHSTYKGDVLPEDQYRRPIQYRVVDAAGGVYRLRSLGADGLPDTDDDIVRPEGASWGDG